MDQRKTSSRPYTVGRFGRKLELFETFIANFTHVDEELNPEERRLQLQERLTNGKWIGCKGFKSCIAKASDNLDICDWSIKSQLSQNSGLYNYLYIGL